MRRALSAVALIAVLLCGPASDGAAAEQIQTVRLQLKWTHQFQAAGFYMALEKGFYRQAGLDVQILEGKPAQDPVKSVIDGQAEFGVGNSGLLIARSKGAPVVAVAAIFQHSPFILLTRASDDIRSVHDLAGRRVMTQGNPAELTAYMRLERAPLDKIRILPHSGGPGALLRGEADAVTAYSTTDPYDLQLAGFSYNVLSPRASGIDFYGDVLFTTEETASRRPKTVKAFRDASMLGWRYAMDNMDEALSVAARYAPSLPRAKLAFEAHEVRRLIQTDMVEPGYMYQGRWRHIADGFAAAGLVPAGLSLKGFLFDHQDKPDLTWLYAGLSAALLAAGLGGWLTARFAGLNKSLKKEIAGRELLEEELRRLAATDSLTGLHNRRRFHEMLEREMDRSRRNGLPLALLLADIDHFKQVNDVYGHGAGDKTLQNFADICRLHLRSADAAGRVGGEEFAVLLPDTDATGAMHAAERIRRETDVNPDNKAHNVTVSIGVAVLHPDDDLSRLFARADRALYCAKTDGRNRVKMEEPSPSAD